MFTTDDFFCKHYLRSVNNFLLNRVINLHISIHKKNSYQSIQYLIKLLLSNFYFIFNELRSNVL